MDATGCWVAGGARESPLDAVPREPIAALSLGGMVLITLAIVFVSREDLAGVEGDDRDRLFRPAPAAVRARRPRQTSQSAVCRPSRNVQPASSNQASSSSMNWTTCPSHSPTATRACSSIEYAVERHRG